MASSMLSERSAINVSALLIVVSILRGLSIGAPPGVIRVIMRMCISAILTSMSPMRALCIPSTCFAMGSIVFSMREIDLLYRRQPEYFIISLVYSLEGAPLHRFDQRHEVDVHL